MLEVARKTRNLANDYRLYNQINLNPENSDQTDSDLSSAEINLRCDYKFHNFITNLSESFIFDLTMMTVIIINSIVMGLETMYIDQESRTFTILNQIFIAIYTIEFLVKIYAKPFSYFKNLWNVFDFVNLILAYFDLAINLIETDSKDKKIPSLFSEQ